jgi:hypothetical protein
LVMCRNTARQLHLLLWGTWVMMYTQHHEG